MDGQQMLKHAIEHLNALGEDENWRASALLWTLVDPLPVITTVLGDSRPAKQFAANGDFFCPYCSNPVWRSKGESQCFAPFCESNPGLTPEALQAIRDKRAAREAEEAERKRNHEWAMERIRKDAEQRDREETDAIRYAHTFGACVPCLVKSRYRKFIVHRTVCPSQAA